MNGPGRPGRADAEFVFRAVQPYVPQGSRVLAVGTSSPELARLLKERAGAQASLVPGFDGKTLPYPSHHFGVVLLLDVLHLADAAALAREARRVTQDAGAVIAMEPSVEGFRDGLFSAIAHLWRQQTDRIKRDAHFRTAAGWQALFQASGFYVDWTVCLGRRGRWFSPSEILYVLSKSGVPIPVSEKS